MDIRELLSKPVAMMTGEELLAIQREAIAEIPKEEVTSTLPEFVYGISGIMQLFNCSKSKAQKIKNSGVITGAIQQDQRTIIVDTRLALKLFKEYTNQKKRRFI